MTPLEKASQMIVDYQLTFKSLSYEEAVQCSIRTVDEIIWEIIKYADNSRQYVVNNIKYWQEVRELLEKQSNKHHIVDTNEMIDQVPDVRKMVEDDNYLTPVDWLMDRIKWIHRETYDYLIKEGQYDRAKRMESSTSSPTEISDEEIEKFTNEFAEKYSKVGVTEHEVSAFFTGMKWYREQLKKKQ